MQRAALSSLLTASLVVACRPATLAKRAGDANLPPRDDETAPALDVPRLLAMREDRRVSVEGYLVRGSGICLSCEDGPPYMYQSNDSVRLADSKSPRSPATVGLNSKSKTYHCWHISGPPEKPCSVTPAGQHVQIRALYVHSGAEHEGPPDICELAD